MTVDFGRDISCLTSLNTTRLVSGVRLVAEAAYRRLTTPPGTLRGGEEEENYGIDLISLIGANTNVALTLPARIRTELLKDERITSCTVNVTVTREGAADTVDIVIVCQTDAGPFDLKLAVSDVTIELVGLSV